jgi:hypothetical protein
MKRKSDLDIPVQNSGFVVVLGNFLVHFQVSHRMMIESDPGAFVTGHDDCEVG